jgi:hypothetical protein
MQIADAKTNTKQIPKNNNKVPDNDPLFERRIQNATDGLSK